MSVYETLSKVDVSEHIEKKNGLSYVSWAWAWHEVKKRFPAAYYTIYENTDGLFYHHDNHTAWVKTGVTIDGLEHIEYLPVMDYKNKSIPVDTLTSFDVNKTIQRSLTKACARHGLGLSVYASEDLPLDAEKEEPKGNAKLIKEAAAKAKSAKVKEEPKEEPKAEEPKKASVQQLQVIQDLILKTGKKEEDICKAYKVKNLQDITVENAAEIYKVLRHYEEEL